MEIEELAFKDRRTLANLNEIDLLEIIEFLQLDRKQWINEYTRSHNDYVELQNNWNELKEWLLNKSETDEVIMIRLFCSSVAAKMQEIESRKKGCIDVKIEKKIIKI